MIPFLAAAGPMLGGAAAAAAATGLTIPIIGGAAAAGLGSGAWSHLASGAASLAGGVYGNYASARQAAINREFQSYMSGTSHQREVEDLRKAGLNPILSASRGASTPGGATASQWDVGTPAVSSALQARINKAQTKQIGEMARTTRLAGDREIATASTARSQERLNNQLQDQSRQQELLLGNNTNIAAFDAQIRGEQLKREKLLTAIESTRFGGNVENALIWSGKLGSARRYSDMITGGSGAKGILDSLNPYKWLIPGKKGK